MGIQNLALRNMYFTLFQIWKLRQFTVFVRYRRSKLAMVRI